VPRGAVSGRDGGGLENLSARLATVGGRMTATVRSDGWFELLADAPAPSLAPDERLTGARVCEREEA
jgi:hypothetical protein